MHDKRIAEATPYPLPAGSQLLQDLGFPAFTLPQVDILMLTKKARGKELTVEQQRANQALHYRRRWIEHVNSNVKRCRIVKDRMRLSCCPTPVCGRCCQSPQSPMAVAQPRCGGRVPRRCQRE